MRAAYQIVNEMLFAVGKTTDTIHSSIDPWQILNRAGRAIYTRFPWPWRAQGPEDLATVADQQYVELPTDFARPLKVTIANGGGWNIETVSMDRIMDLRQSAASFSGSAGLVRVSFIPYDTQPSGKALPKPRMEIYPTPTTNGEPTFSLRYERKWKELSTSDPNIKPNLPNEAEQALIYKGQALLKLMVEGSDGGMEAACEAKLQRLIGEQAGTQMNYGRMRGGAEELVSEHEQGGPYGPPIDSLTWS